MARTVVHNTPERLVMDDTPWRGGIVTVACILGLIWAGMSSLFSGDLGGLLILILVPIVGYAGLALVVVKVRLTLDAETGKGTIHRLSIQGPRTETFLLEDVDRVELGGESHSEGGRVYRPVLIMSGTESPPKPVWTGFSSAPHEKASAQIISDWFADLRGHDRTEVRKGVRPGKRS